MKRSYWYILITFITFVIGSFILYFEYLNLNQQRRQNTLEFINIVRSAINPLHVSQLHADNTDLKNPDFLRLQEQLTKLATTYPNLRYLYIMRLDGNQIKFLIDVKSPTFSSDIVSAVPGEIYPEAQNNLYQLFSQNNIVVVGPETDKWGTFISTLGSVVDSQDNIIAVIGADFDSSTWNQEIMSSLFKTIIYFPIVLIIEWLIIGSLYRSRQHQNTLSYLATILDYCNDAIYSTDINGVVKSWNQGATKIFGFTEFEVLGKKITELIYPEDKKHEFKQIISSAVLGQNIIKKETVRQNKSGQPITVLITESPIYQNGTIAGVSIVIKDITAESTDRQKIMSRNQELEKTNSLLINRELKMVELKEKINQLQSKK